MIFCNFTPDFLQLFSYTLPHDDMLARYMLSSCVHPSVTSQSSTKMAEPRVTRTMLYHSPGTLVCGGQRSLPQTSPFSKFCIPFHIFIVGGDRDFKFGRQVDSSKS